MATLVLNNDSISVNLESDHLVIRQYNKEGALETLPIKDVERVFVIGRPAISFHVLARFMDRQIPCSFLTKGYRLRGFLNSGGDQNVARRLLQYDKLRQADVCLMLSRELIRAKLRNSRRVIQRLCANRESSISNENEHWHALNACLTELDSVCDCDAIRGVEGLASFHYFRLLSSFFPSSFQFESRSRRPPLDPANAVLSFIYTILMNEVWSAVRLHALDAGLGFLHQDRERSPSLALDLMEPFRSGFADLLTINLLSHSRLNAETDFEKDIQSGGVYLTANARGKVLAACETAFSRSFKQIGKTIHTTMRLAIDEQIVQFVGYLEKGTKPEFFKLA